jgi:hypothetical protein
MKRPRNVAYLLLSVKRSWEKIPRGWDRGRRQKTGGEEGNIVEVEAKLEVLK